MNDNEKKPPEKNRKQGPTPPPGLGGCSFRTVTMWVMLGLLAYVLVIFLGGGSDRASITYSELLSYAERGSVKPRSSPPAARSRESSGPPRP